VIRVVLADDHAVVRAGFRLILETEPDIDVVGEAADGREAVTLAALESPDVILMDVQMPGANGLEATRLIAEKAPDVRVLILTTFERDDYVFGALRNGAAGFMLKNSPPEDVIDAVRTVAGGDSLLAPSVTRRIIEEYVRNGGTPVAPPELDAVTGREREVLVQVGRGLSNREIAEVLFVGEATVKSHVSAILAKLGLRDRVQAVVFAYEAGLIRPGMDR
jgi:DNA-binding NarL/FixJ family response regulator